MPSARLTLLIICTSATLAYSGSANQEWGWSKEDAEGHSQCAQKLGCKGHYHRDVTETDSIPLEQAPLNAKAEDTKLDMERVELKGKVELQKGPLKIAADKVEWQRGNELVDISGNIQVEQQELKFTGSRATLDMKSGLGSIEDARFLHYASGSRASADNISRTAEQVVQLQDTRYTQCPPEEQTWELRAGSLILNYESGWATARDVSLRAFDAPIFWTPWLEFPVDDRRMTGLLTPVIGTSDQGLDVSLPYYLNLGPNYDATLTPRFIADRGTMLEAEGRYLNPLGEWVLSTGYLENDDETGEQRWLFGFNHEGGITLGGDGSLATLIDYTRVSDDNYFRDLSIESLQIRRATHLNQRAQLNYLSDDWQASINLERFQTIADVDEPLRKLPELVLAYKPRASNFELRPLLETRLTWFDHQDPLEDGGAQITGQRSWTDAALEVPIAGAAGHFIARGGIRHLRYNLDTPDQTSVNANNTFGRDDPSATSLNFSVDAGLVFEKQLSSGGRQTLEPRVFYRYADFEGQSDFPNFDTSNRSFAYEQLFSDNRFAGHDLLDDTDQVTLALTSRFIDAEHQREWFSVTLGQIAYLDDREVTLDGSVDTSERSPLIGQLTYQPNESVWLGIEALHDTENNQARRHQLNLQIQQPNDAIYNLSWSARDDSDRLRNVSNRDRLHQAEFSASVPISNQWQLFTAAHRDIRGKRWLERMVGVEYEDCCWRARVIFQRSLEPDNNDRNANLAFEEEDTLLFEFEFKGLGSSSKSSASILSDSIYGYEDR